MELGNVLVIGNSGVGKSTLINAIIGDEVAETGRGSEGTTKKLTIYPVEKAGLRLVDTAGFEPNPFKKAKIINEVQKWSKQSALEEDHSLHVIWFCVDGTSSKLFSSTIKDLMKATSLWKTVPIIVVITKSYSEPERGANIRMVKEIFQKQKKAGEKLRGIVPVVAAPYVLNENAFASPYGITELIDLTVHLLPEGKQASKQDVSEYKLQRKRIMAQSVVGTATAAAVVIGAVPIPFPDALLLSPTEMAEINAIAAIYEIPNNDKGKEFMNTIIQVGTVGAVARIAINALKAIPGIDLAASVINAITAGTLVAAIGEGSIFAYEQISLGNKSLGDLDWVRKHMESVLSKGFVSKATKVLEEVAKGADKDQIVVLIRKSFLGK